MRTTTETPTPLRPRRALRAALAAGLFALVASAPAGAQMLSMSTPEVDWQDRLGETVPAEVELLDEQGRRVRIGELVGDRPAILALVYYDCPMLCNLVLDGLTASLDALEFRAGEEFDVLVVSIDPGETPAMAAERRAKYLAEERLPGDPAGWHFLVGDQEQVHALASAVGFSYTYVPETDEYAHAAGVTLLTAERVVSRVLFGVDYEPRDLKFALMDASEGTIGSAFDKVLLRCFAYDPQHGAYGFAIMTAIRIGGVATLLVLGLFVLRSLRREKRPASTTLHAHGT